MKFQYLILILFILVFVSGCVSETPYNKTNEQQQPLAENIPLDITQAPETENVPPITESSAASTPAADKAVQEPKQLPQKPGIVPDYPDSFDGQVLDTAKYSTLIKGSGSIMQDNEIVSSGNAKDEIIWSILYTNQNIDFTKDFKISMDVNLTETVERGDAMAIVAIENMDEIQSAKMPERRFCEISAGSSHGTMLRLPLSGHGSQLFSTTGKLQLSFNALKENLECSFEDEKGVARSVDEQQKIQFGQYHLTLRGGIHSITGGGTEQPADGSFTVRYDNLNIINK